MDRYWFLTWTTYGTWLPCDERGFVGPIDDHTGGWEIHNHPGTPYDSANDRLLRFSQAAMTGLPVFLDEHQARAISEQFQETANKRKWELVAYAVMSNHVHLAVGVPGDPDPANILRDFKSYASGKLNKKWAKPQSGTWWTESGSKRKLADENFLFGAVRYVAQQANPHLIWLTDKFRNLLYLGERPV